MIHISRPDTNLIITVSTANGANGFGRIAGILTKTGWGLTVGCYYYVDASGNLTTTPTNNAIGFAISLPDLNVLLRGLGGRLLEFGWLKLLRGIKRLKQYRMWALGVVPEYQRRAVEK